MALPVGAEAPDFTLPTLGGEGPELWNLKAHEGEKAIVLLFVPMAFTGVCTQEFCEITQTMNEYTDLNAEVVGISGDNPFAQAAWAEKEGINMTLLSDYEHKVATEYGVAYDAFLPDKNLTMGGVPKRSAFVIDKAGVIVYSESNDNPGELPDFAAIKAKLGELG